MITDYFTEEAKSKNTVQQLPTDFVWFVVKVYQLIIC